MAASGAHITSATPQSDDRPSIFEVLAQESLVHALKPAIQHLLRILAERNPARLGKLYVYSDEVYLALHFVLEQYYLKHYSASFSENFYGMKRVATHTESLGGDHSSVNDTRSFPTDSPVQHLYNGLPRLNQLRSVFFLVLVPYLKNKCDAWYEALKDMQANPGSHNFQNKKWKWQLCRVYLKLYPVFHFIYESIMMVTHLSFAFNKSHVHSPFLTMAGVILQNLSEEDLALFNKPTATIDLRDKTFVQALAHLSSRALSTLAVVLSGGMSVGIFFLQFLEWWYSSPQHSTKLFDLPNPPPPQPRTDVSVPKLNIMCPLCQKVRTNDTALSVSGYVFCYGCINSFVTRNKCCPVTKYPATSENLVRLYLPES